MTSTKTKKKITQKKPTRKSIRKKRTRKERIPEKKDRGIWIICCKCQAECEAGEWECDSGSYICLKCLGREKRNTLYINVEEKQK